MKKMRFYHGLLATIFITACGSNQLNMNPFENVKQTKNSVELGERIRLIDLVDNDESDIQQISVLDDGGFDSKIPGNYTVTYSIKNTNGDTGEKTFSFTVQDTVAPELHMIEEVIYVKQGEVFNIDEYAEASDESNTQQIKYKGDIDTSKEAEYEIEVFAIDAYNNQSEGKCVSVFVEDRSNCDIRNAKFGDSMDTVQRYEEGKFITKDDNNLMYSDSLNGMGVNILFTFNEFGELYNCGYSCNEIYTNYLFYIDKYDGINKILVEKYGKADKTIRYKGSLYDYCHDDGEALQIGQLLLRDEWHLEKMNITTQLENRNEVALVVLYVSNVIQEPSTDNNNL